MCRNLEEGETELKGNEKFLLDLICKAYYLPKWCSINDYEAIFRAEGLQVTRLFRLPDSWPAACVFPDLLQWAAGVRVQGLCIQELQHMPALSSPLPSIA